MRIGMTVLTLAALAALLGAEWFDSRSGRWVAKPVASAGFVGTALAVGAAASGYGRALLAALVLSFAGDLFLLSPGRAAFLGGLGAFLVGHLAFAVAFLVRGAGLGWSAVALVPLVALALAVARWLLPRVDPGMRAPVTAYIVVIVCMVALAVGCAVRSGAPIVAVAAVLFFLSDLSVARDRFVAPGFANRLWGLPVYYVAQLLFAWSAAP